MDQDKSIKYALDMLDKLKARDFLIDGIIDKYYLEPIMKEYSDYGGKREIILLGMIIGYEFSKTNSPIPNCVKDTVRSSRVDIGRIKEFPVEGISLMLSILIDKYGIEKVISEDLNEKFEELRTFAENGVKIIYCEIISSRQLRQERFAYINDIKKLL